MRKRRYEILLPLTHNDGQPVSGELHEQTRESLIKRFKALTFWPQSVRGMWIYKGARYDEELALVVVDVADTKANRQCFLRLKASLLRRFEQIEIYIASYAVDSAGAPAILEVISAPPASTP